MGAVVVVADDQSTQFHVELVEGQLRDGLALSGSEVAREDAEQFGVHGAEETLNLPATLWPCDRGVHKLEMQVGGNLHELVAGEVRTVVDVENIGDAAHRPVRLTLMPHRLAKRQRRIHRRRCAKEDHVTARSTGLVVEDDGQPGPGRLSVRGDDENVEHCVM